MEKKHGEWDEYGRVGYPFYGTLYAREMAKEHFKSAPKEEGNKG
jgi:hypothetical protein